MSVSKLQDYEKVLEIISDENIFEFIVLQLQKSLKSIGFSGTFINGLILNLKSLDGEFIEKHREELERVETTDFFQVIVPDYFSNIVVPLISASGTMLDIGCGTGVLAHILDRSPQFNRIVGIDLKPYPEWGTFRSEKVEFQVVPEGNFPEFVSGLKPDAITLTWTLHHMEYSEQKRYLKYLRDLLNQGTEVVVLEDAFSEFENPTHGADVWDSFRRWDNEKRQQIMFVFC